MDAPCSDPQVQIWDYVKDSGEAEQRTGHQETTGRSVPSLPGFTSSQNTGGGGAAGKQGVLYFIKTYDQTKRPLPSLNPQPSTLNPQPPT